jgi:hypothetical protein
MKTVKTASQPKFEPGTSQIKVICTIYLNNTLKMHSIR